MLCDMRLVVLRAERVGVKSVHRLEVRTLCSAAVVRLHREK